MVFIYILQLQSNKYYIGKTSNPKFRLDSHFNSNGSAWTKKYRPIKLIKLIPNCDNFDEDKHTLKYMEKYGINNVRGGSFCQIKLTNENKNTIEKMINGASDRCYICGMKGHFANDCQEDNDNWGTIFHKLYKILMGKERCSRCHREGHSEENCYTNNGDAISDSEEGYEEIEIWSCEYCGKEFGSKKGALLHENAYCRNKKYKTRYDSNDKKSNDHSSNYYRCGRKGHYSNNCYAIKHIKDYYLS